MFVLVCWVLGLMAHLLAVAVLVGYPMPKGGREA